MGGDGSSSPLPFSGVGGRRRAEPYKRLLKKRERWIVILGVVLHAVYMLSIFDIYFKTPIVHGMEPVKPRINPPAKRLVLLIADGLRADKFFEPDSEGQYRAPFLRSVIRTHGRWGVSHARPPTESRPGHVAIIAGFYEDPSAVTKGWKANPVEFDSLFNRSQHTFAFGSPDIIPIFCSQLPHSIWSSYPHEFEDFASDASFLDEWSYDQFHSLLNRSSDDPKLKQLLLQDNVVIFLHLLGCDTNGHAHRPYSPIYLNNVKVVDHIAERTYDIVERFFGDNQTAYIFTADHGMSDKGSHGDGHPSNTDTPIVAWGAGIRTPKQLFRKGNYGEGSRFVDEHTHNMPTPIEWGLNSIERVDVNQADIAPLMATLLGLPCPMNSVGNLPLGYMNLREDEEVEAALANAKQVLNQFLRKSQLKQSNSLNFKPFKPLENYTSVLHHIEHLIAGRDYEAALRFSQNLRELSLEGFHYFQTYDWLMLMSTVTLGYVGWMGYLILHVLKSYTRFPGILYKKKNQPVLSGNSNRKVYLCGSLLMGIFTILLFVENAPVLYHVYVAMTVFLWTQIFNDTQLIKSIWRDLSSSKVPSVIKLSATCTISVFILELLVASFFERKLYTLFFLIAGVVGALFVFFSIPGQSLVVPIFIWVSCWSLSIFTMMPAEIPDNTHLVVASGVLLVVITTTVRWFESSAKGDKYWQYIINCEKKKANGSWKLFYFQAVLIGLSSWMVWLSTLHRTQKRELLTFHQLINWILAGLSMVLPLFSPTHVLARLFSIFLGLAPPFLLLSIGYEAVFYVALALVLLAWILIECAVLYLTKSKEPPTYIEREESTLFIHHDERCLWLSDLRVPLIFMVLFNVAFFGTGNFASIASFEISSVYRFITVFNPFLMAALLIFKLFIPFMLVICVFSAITKLIRVPRLGCYFVVILLSDVMTIHFFFMVRNTGSWMEIGNSISHFGIMSAQVVFVLLLFALTNVYTKDIQVSSPQPSSRKAI